MNQGKEAGIFNGLIIAMSMGFLCAHVHVSAQSIDYINSPLHKDLNNISKKLDEVKSNSESAAKGTLITATIMNGLKSLGNALENEKFKDASENIFNSGEWKIYTANTGLGPLTIVYGSAKFAVLINNSTSQMAGKYDETSPGVLQKGRLKIDLNEKKFTTNPIFGSGENSTLTLIDSSENQK